MNWQGFKKAVIKDESDDLDVEQTAEAAASYLNSIDEPLKAEKTLLAAVLVETAFAVCVFFFSDWINEWTDDHFPVGQVILNGAVFALGFLIGFTVFHIHQSKFRRTARNMETSFMRDYENRSKASLILMNCFFSTVVGVINVVLLHIAFNFLQ